MAQKFHALYLDQGDVAIVGAVSDDLAERIAGILDPKKVTALVLAFDADMKIIRGRERGTDQ